MKLHSRLPFKGEIKTIQMVQLQSHFSPKISIDTLVAEVASKCEIYQGCVIIIQHTLWVRAGKRNAEAFKKKKF